MSSNNPFEAVAAAAAGTTNNTTLRASGSEVSSLSSSTTDLPSTAGLTDTLAAVNAMSSTSVDISRHPSGIVPVLQYSLVF